MIIGLDMTSERKRKITEALNSALLTDEEMAGGINAFHSGSTGGAGELLVGAKAHPWRCLEDPFFGDEAPNRMWELQFKEG